MDIKKYEDAMRQQTKKNEDDDPETTHRIADDILCDILIELGYENLVDLFHKVPKWYA